MGRRFPAQSPYATADLHPVNGMPAPLLMLMLPAFFVRFDVWPLRIAATVRPCPGPVAVAVAVAVIRRYGLYNTYLDAIIRHNMWSMP